MTDFDRGFRAGADAAADYVLTQPGHTIHPDSLPARIRKLQPPQQPDAAPSDKVWTDLEDIARRLRDLSAAHLEDRKRCDAAVAAWRALPDERRDWVVERIAAVDPLRLNSWTDAIDAALALLRSLAPEAGDADGGR